MATVTSARWGRMPRWITLLLGVACVFVGATLVTRPFRSLAVLILLGYETGGQVEYRTYEGFDHVGVVGAESPLVPYLLAWTHDRFAGKATPSTC